ncbi:protein adenylyltransferase SelO [Aurantivibrio plasticivorans]
MTSAVKIPFNNTFCRLNSALFAYQAPTPVQNPGLIRVNDALAALLGIDPLQLKSEEGVAALAGNVVPEGAEPIATAYAGHQFGNWNPQLGDGRAILLGEVIGKDGARYDIQLKGAGVTPFSRMGDGRSPLGPVLREYVVSEAMAVLGVPTTRSLAAVTTGEKVIRDEILPGAILTRIAKSHIRVGTFQFFAARQQRETLTILADHVIDRHYPDAKNAGIVYLELLNCVIRAQAKLIAHWQSLGFIHGVMNTDNMLVSGETVDYGPCAFMEEYHPGMVFSSIDRQGRYAYGNQPAIAQWNLAWLAQSLLPLIHDDEDKSIELVQQALDNFKPLFTAEYQQRMFQKVGIDSASAEAMKLLNDFLPLLQANNIDFTLGFRVLADYLDETHTIRTFYALPGEFDNWIAKWNAYLSAKDSNLEEVANRMRQVNPVYIPRNHQIEVAIQAGNRGDFEPFHQLVDRLSNPFDFDPTHTQYALPATDAERVTQTFCGT